jgi:lantibiotic modifying enzyme
MHDERPRTGTPDVPALAGAGTSWRPILAGDARARALKLVDEVAERIDACRADIAGDVSLSAGAAGLAVFYAQLERAGRGGEQTAGSLLDEAMDGVATQPLGPSLYAGFPGVAWSVDYVSDALELPEDPLAAVDETLVGALDRADWDRAPYDLIYGLVGIGVYAMARWPRANSAEMLTLVTRHLSNRARRGDDGAYWWTPPELLLGPRRTQSPSGVVDLGVAHGMAGVVPLLARAGRLGAGGSAVTELADAAAKWLLRHAVPDELGGGTIPAFVASPSDARPARSAWCYGDPGVSATLLLAAADIGCPWALPAQQLAVRAAERPERSCGVVDAGFCHGSAGLAHLFNVMYQLTGERVLRSAATTWLDRTLNTVSAGLRRESALTVQQVPQLPWNGLGLLEGLAGIALVLLAASTPVTPSWDAMFLVSSPALRQGDRTEHG